MAHQVDAKQMLDDRGYSGKTIHDTNPAHLLEKAVRDRITDSYYWKEQCFAINEATLCDRAADMTFLGGTYGQQRPTPFLCLTLKLLQLLPGRDIVLLYLHQPDFKYLSALAAFYVRLTFDAVDVYKTLEPLLADYRKLRRRTRDGGYVLTYLDQFVDDLLTKERVCGTSLRKLPQRSLLEDLGQLEERVSPLGDEIDEIDRESGTDAGIEGESEEEGDEEEATRANETRNGNGAARDMESEEESEEMIGGESQSEQGREDDA
jgi:pre-mRNA-splicing factor 38A